MCVCVWATHLIVLLALWFLSQRQTQVLTRGEGQIGACLTAGVALPIPCKNTEKIFRRHNEGQKRNSLLQISLGVSLKRQVQLVCVFLQASVYSYSQETDLIQTKKPVH